MQKSRVLLALFCIALFTVASVRADRALSSFADTVSNAFDDAVNSTVSVAHTVENGASSAYNTVANKTVGAYNTVANGTVGAYNTVVSAGNKTVQSAMNPSSAEHLSAVRVGAIVAALPLAMWALL